MQLEVTTRQLGSCQSARHCQQYNASHDAYAPRHFVRVAAFASQVLAHMQAHSSAAFQVLRRSWLSPGLTQTLSYWPLSTPLSTKPWIFSISQSTSGTCREGTTQHHCQPTLSGKERVRKRGEEKRVRSSCHTPHTTVLRAHCKHPLRHHSSNIHRPMCPLHI